MKNSSLVLKTGSRSSNLALIQCRATLKKLSAIFTDITFDLTPLSSPGDRDKKLDLTTSPENFFTEDLDNKVLSGELDCAIHSAKDMPYPVKDGLDWFWFPWNEDPRDVYILAEGKEFSDLPDAPIMGVSSDRRVEWCKNLFPKGIDRAIRGTIEERIQQLDDGDFDIIVMASAALNRLNLQHRANGYISEKELPPPEGQGYLSITFRADDIRFKQMRSLFVKAVTFTGAGCGRASLCTTEGINSLKECDICLYDSLIDESLLLNLPDSAKKIFAGKRGGKHLSRQSEICEQIGNYVRQGKKVVRLKGGDPAIFGRLIEEITLLDSLGIPYNIIPGISTLLGATGPSGILLTQRGLSNGFSVITPKKIDDGKREISLNDLKDLPIVLFMAVKSCGHVIFQLKSEGVADSTPATMIFNGGNYDEEIIFATVNDLEDKLKSFDSKNRPGLLVIGKCVNNAFKNRTGALIDKKILITSSEILLQKGIDAVKTFGGRAIPFPLIELVDNGNVASIFEELKSYDYLILSSPSVIRLFFNTVKNHKVDIRTVPEIIVSGKQSEKLLNEYLIEPFAVANGIDASLEISKIFGKIEKPKNILTLGSNVRGKKLREDLINFGFKVKDVNICENREVVQKELPDFDAVTFSSGSAIKSFISQFGKATLDGKIISIMGTPSERVLNENLENSNYLMSNTHSIESQVYSLAEYFINQNLKEIL